MPAAGELGDLASLELGRSAPDSEFVIEGLRGAPVRTCWCGRALADSPRAIRLSRIPAELATFRGRCFHSCACGVAYTARTVSHLDEYLRANPEGPRAGSAARLRDLLKALMGQLIAFELTWV